MWSAATATTVHGSCPQLHCHLPLHVGDYGVFVLGLVLRPLAFQEAGSVHLHNLVSTFGIMGQSRRARFRWRCWRKGPLWWASAHEGDRRPWRVRQVLYRYRWRRCHGRWPDNQGSNPWDRAGGNHEKRGRWMDNPGFLRRLPRDKCRQGQHLQTCRVSTGGKVPHHPDEWGNVPLRQIQLWWCYIHEGLHTMAFRLWDDGEQSIEHRTMTSCWEDQ